MVAVTAAIVVVVLAASVFAIQHHRQPGDPHRGLATTITPSVPVSNASNVTPAPHAHTPIISVISVSTTSIKVRGDFVNPSLFATGTTVDLVARTNADVKAGDVLSIRWIVNGVDVTAGLQQSHPGCCMYQVTAESNAGVVVAFHFSPAQPRSGLAELFYNGTLADTVVVDVEMKQAPSNVSLRRQTLDAPGSIRQSVANAIMQPVGATLPELDNVRSDTIAQCGGQGDRAIGVLRLEFAPTVVPARRATE